MSWVTFVREEGGGEREVELGVGQDFTVNLSTSCIR